MKRFVLALSTLLVLTACEATIQQVPVLVGRHQEKPAYSIRGFTPAGRGSAADARAYAVEVANVYCASGDAAIVDLATGLARRSASGQIGWSALFTCSQVRW